MERSANISDPLEQVLLRILKTYYCPAVQRGEPLNIYETRILKNLLERNAQSI